MAEPMLASPTTTKRTSSISLATITYAIAILIGAILISTSTLLMNLEVGKERFGQAVLTRRDVSPPPIIPQQPAAYPSPNENFMISDAYLNDEIVTSSLSYVQSVVSAALLNVAPSTYVRLSRVTYRADPVANCYWAANLCTRTTSGNWGLPDIVYCPQNYQWGLTYDDAPSENFVNGVHYNDTVALMDELDVLNLKATFFITGSQSSYYPVSLIAIANRGHHVAHHSWSHHPFTSLTNEQIVAEMMYTAAIIYNSTGLSPRYFRPPYGDIDDRVRAIINALGFRIVMWDSKYDATDADVTANAANFGLVENIITSWFNTVPGFIALQHTISTFTSGTSIASLKTIQAMGGITNQMMPVPQCLGDPQWYKNARVTTIYNSCTIPTGCSAGGMPPSAQPVGSGFASPGVSPSPASHLVNTSSGAKFVLSKILLVSGVKERFGRAVLSKRTVSPPPAIPLQPAAYALSDENIMIFGAFVNDSIVTSAIAHVQSIVPAALLTLLPTFQSRQGHIMLTLMQIVIRLVTYVIALHLGTGVHLTLSIVLGIINVPWRYPMVQERTGYDRLQFLHDSWRLWFRPTAISICGAFGFTSAVLSPVQQGGSPAASPSTASESAIKISDISSGTMFALSQTLWVLIVGVHYCMW
ncbi:hypothetical protein SmJEL517_g00102 [Synchytrium microbalum]|uniref:NodB homology domain-containing protein n=1 Tax=Synchytrium microbalum TaxID=1806994 RepID=A0A507CFH2_9FUNG|nr:uncharacterized protein SmJEL517_g00102 [Synchytrium microbalum]TPX38108.1 hypothetical protein SmJEL517_g00102 [Synchytrium microbalum]